MTLVAAALTALAFADGGYGQTAFGIATVIAWLIAGIAVLRGARPAALPPRARLAFVLLAALAVLSALSMAWANDAGRAFASAVRVAGYAGLFALALVWLPRTGPRPWLAGIALGSGAILAAALASRFDPSILGGGDRVLNSAIPSAAGRLSYPIGYWNGLAACLATGIVLSLWFAVRGASSRVRAAAAGSLPAYGLAMYLTSSRGSAVAALGGAALLLVLERERVALLVSSALGAAGAGALIAVAHGSDDFLGGLATSSARDFGLAMAVATLAACVAAGMARRALDPRLTGRGLSLRPGRRGLALIGVLFAASLVVANPPERWRDFKRADFSGRGATPGQRSFVSAGGSGRYQFWSAAIDAYGSRPASGVGAGNFELYWGAHPGGPVAIRNAHSLYLETLAELGPLGLALLLGFLAMPAAAGFRRAREGDGEAAAATAVLTAAALAAAVDWTFQLPAAYAPGVVAAAIAVAGGVPGGTRRLGRAWAIVLAVLAWASIWAAGTLVASDRLLASSRSEAAAGDREASADRARAAASLEPFSPEPRIQLALVERLAGQLEAASADAQRSIDLADGDWRTWYVASRIASAAGQGALADTYLRRAAALAPVPLPSSGSRPR